MLQSHRFQKKKSIKCPFSFCFAILVNAKRGKLRAETLFSQKWKRKAVHEGDKPQNERAKRM